MKLEQLTSETFAPYGKVLNQRKEDPDAENNQFTFDADITFFEWAGEGTVGILEGKRRELVLTCMERHVNTPEILFQLSGEAILAVSKPNIDSQEITGVQTFLLRQGQSILMAPGTWHWVPYPAGGDSCLTQVIFKRGTSETDCQIIDMPEAVRLG